MFEFAKIYVRSIIGISGLTFVMLYSIHMGSVETNVMLAGMAGIVACVGLDKQTTMD